MNRRILIVWLLGATLFVVPAAHAETEYTDEDSEYIKVAGFFLEPVGQMLEWLVFRPIHAVHHFVDAQDSVDERAQRVCTGLRPRRECTSARDRYLR